MGVNAEKWAKIIKDKAKEKGFDSCGISKAEFLQADAPRLENYLKNNFHGKMSYLENHFDKRLDPRLLVEGARSVISLRYNYFPEKELDFGYKISKYAYGQDYHEVIKEILRELVAELQEEIGDFHCRIFVDSAPVLEKSWAEKSGLGWIGKNGLLISKKSGSFFFLAEMICDLELLSDEPLSKDFCGSCTRCIDACPTQAIVQNKVIDGSKCISYLTIELKGEIPSDFSRKFDHWIFGCDICQDVCPWNRFSLIHDEKKFLPTEGLKKMEKSDWKDLTQEIFSEIFKKSAVKRTKFSGLMRNINFIDAQKKKEE